jgi:alkylation response protein AidB-like acyl-CoA dehydrogenase
VPIDLFGEEHASYRTVLRTFIADHVVPNYDAWLEAGQVPRELYHRLGELGVFGIQVPEEYGGSGITSFTYSAVQIEELARAAVSFGGSSAHVTLCLPYLKLLADQEQRRRWLPDFATGATMWALAMTEPGTGSDLAAMRTTARLSDDGSHYVLNGAKTFITGGVHADRVIVCARTAPPADDDRRHGLTLLAVDAHSPGYAVGRALHKIGLTTSDTAELSFTDVQVPVGDRLGEEHRAFGYLRHNLPLERLGIAYGAYAQAAAALRFAVDYVHSRTVFGQALDSFQNTKFELAACRADVDALEAVAQRALEAYEADALTPAAAASAKLFCTETSARVIDRCLQLHGGYGYMQEYPIARLYVDNRVNRIYGGTSEVMKMIVAKELLATSR